MDSLGDRLASMRGFRRLTLQELAERTGLKAQNISRIENDHRQHVRSDTLRQLAEALDCSTDFLVGLSDDIQPPRRKRRKTEDDEPAHELVKVDGRMARQYFLPVKSGA